MNKRFLKIAHYRCYTNEKVVDMPKNRAQFTPMRTTAADSITKLFITLDKNRTARSFVRQAVGSRLVSGGKCRLWEKTWL
jgi:hypothetical protein